MTEMDLEQLAKNITEARRLLGIAAEDAIAGFQRCGEAFRMAGTAAAAVLAAPELQAILAPTTTTPEDTLRAAGIDDARQAEYQRRMSMMLGGTHERR